jgi:hypothetical protein
MGDTILERYLCMPPMYVPPLNLWNINQFRWGWRKASRCPHCLAFAVEDQECKACGFLMHGN